MDRSPDRLRVLFPQGMERPVSPKEGLMPDFLIIAGSAVIGGWLGLRVVIWILGGPVTEEDNED